MAIGFEEGSGVKGGTRYMATYAMGVLPGREGLTRPTTSTPTTLRALPLREGLTGRAGGCRRRACMPAGLAERRAELELGLHAVQEGGEA